MKTVESRNATATIMRETRPFFSKESNQHFFGSSKSEKPFFPDSGNYNSSIQPKLEIGQPDDAYEKEADTVADRVVTRIPETESVHSKPSIDRSLIQNKTEGTDEKVKELKEEEDPVPEVKKIRKKPIFESNSESQDEDVTIQRSAENTNAQTADHSIENSLNSTGGSGHQLPQQTRQQMESSIGADFSNVRIHNDSNAAQLSKDLNAQAFTHGNDIYFNSGKYDPESQTGQHLLAHELTHTIQQNRNEMPALRMSLMIQREAEGDKKDIKDLDNSAISALGTTKEGYVKKNGAKIEIHFKDFQAKQYASPFLTKDEKGNEYISSPPFLKPTKERKTKQSYVWKKNATPLVEASLTALATSRNLKGPLYQLMPAPELKKHNIKRIVITGSIEQIAKEVSVPFWGLDGRPVKHQIEHKVDWQVAGGNHDVDVISNLILLNDKENIRIGQFILNGMKKYYSKVISFYKTKNIQGFTDDFDIAKGIYDIYTDNLVSDPYNVKGSLISISNMDPGKTLNPVSEKLVDIMDEDIPEGHFSLKTSIKGAGNIVPYNLNNEFIEIKGDAKSHKLISVTLKKVVKDEKGVVDEDNPDKSLEFIKESGDHYKVKTEGYAGVLKDIIRFKSLSPIEWEDIDFNPATGWNASGKIKTSVELLDKANITIELENSEFTIQSVIESDVLKGKLPKPFNIDYSSITIAAGTKDPFSIKGNVGFSIEKVGKGSLKATAGYNKFGLEGKFDFDQLKSLKKSEIAFKYLKQGDKAEWEIAGELSVEKGAIKGVENASVKIKYDGKILSGEGEAKLLVPGIDKIKLGATFAENGDFSFTGEVELKKLPGIKSGNVKVTVISKGEEGMKLGLSGEAEPDLPKVPGLTGVKLSISYLDGVFEVRTKVGYKKGRFDGTIEVGITNRQVDEKGQPQGEAPEKGDVLVFGYGKLKVDIYKGIGGSVSVRLTPERDVLIGGTIEAKEIKPFGDGFNYNKEILPFPELEFPLIGIPGMSVSAFIKGGVYFKFSWDPLILKEILIDFKETNINELEKASLEISGSVGSSAHAEVYLSLEAGLKARVLIAELSGSLAGEAGLGLDAEAGGKVDAAWDMEKGLRFREIRAYLDVTPKAIFRLKGKVSVDLDLWVTEINLYYHEWVLAEKSLDLSGVTLKLDFPVKFNEEGNVILPEYENMNVVKPDFTGNSGKAIIDDAINGEAKEKEAAKKAEIRAQIKSDLRSADKDKLTPTEYTKKMMKKHQKSPEMQEFVRQTIEDECRLLEYEHFENHKNFIRNTEAPLGVKINAINVFSIFYAYVTPSDVEAFRAELAMLEAEKKMKEALAAAQAAQNTDNKKVNGTPGPPNQPPADNNGKPVQKKEMPEGVPLNRKSAFDSEEEEDTPDNARMKGGNPGEEFEQKLDQSGGKGQSIPEEERGQMEELMGADFSGVRIHNDPESHELNKQINAQAFTRGNDVFFKAGKYDPSTTEGQRLLAHELAHVIQQEGDRLTIRVQLHAVAATPRARKTHDDIFGKGPATGMTLRDFKTYTGQQADWFVEPTLTTPDRNDLWKLLLKTRPDSPVLSGVGDLTVTELRGVTDAQWIDLNVYCRGTDSSAHTVRIVPSGSLADRIALGSTLKELETIILPIVLEHTITEIQLKRIQSEALLVPLKNYFTLFHPHLQETISSASKLKGGVKSETELLLDFIKAPGMGPFASLLGTVRNLHRFAPDALTQLMANYADFSHKKPVYLVLFSGHDHNSAFIRSKSLFENLLKDKSKLVLMLEGQGSIQDIIDKIPKFAKDYGMPDKGKVNRIAQVMIAGHGSSRSVQLAGTGAPTVNAQGEVHYGVESLDLDKNAAKSVKLLEVLMDNMDPATARMVYAGCLVGSKEIPVKDSTGKALTAADIAKEVNDPARKSLAAFTRDMAAARGKPGMVVEGARASVGLAESKALTDAAGNLHVDYTYDPTAFGTANVYASTGREPEGIMRAAVELAAVDPIVAANQLRIRQGIPPKDIWYDPVTLIFVKAALDGVPPVGGIDIVKVNQLSHMAPHFFLSYWAGRSIGHFGADVNVNPALASTLYTEMIALPVMSAPGDLEIQQGRFILELAWCMMTAARANNVISYLDGKADLKGPVLGKHLEIAWLNPANSSAALFPAAAAASDGRIRLAIAWLNIDSTNADVRAFLNSQVDDTGPQPRLKPAVLGQLLNPADEDDILLTLGRLSPTVSKGSTTLPAANADVFPNGKGPALNDVRIEPNVYIATVIPPAHVLNVRTLPSMAGKPFHWLKRGESVNVMGFVHNWAAVDINGRLGFAHKNFLTAPPV